jgi:hypothetical protein
MAERYKVGTAVELFGTFTHPKRGVVDPTTVSVAVKRPSGTIDTLTATKISTGRYTAVYPTVGLPGGEYVVTWTGTGTGAVVEQDTFTLEAPV